jgi:hypothetical protein
LLDYSAKEKTENNNYTPVELLIAVIGQGATFSLLR